MRNRAKFFSVAAKALATEWAMDDTGLFRVKRSSVILEWSSEELTKQRLHLPKQARYPLWLLDASDIGVLARPLLRQER